MLFAITMIASTTSTWFCVQNKSRECTCIPCLNVRCISRACYEPHVRDTNQLLRYLSFIESGIPFEVHLSLLYYAVGQKCFN